MLLQRTAQLQPMTTALCLAILNEPVNQLTAGKRSLICHAVLLSQLQDGVLVPYETETTLKVLIRQVIVCGGAVW